MTVFDVLGKKRKKELDLPPPPPPPVDDFEFPVIPPRREPSIPEPKPIPVFNIKKSAEEHRLNMPAPRELHFKPVKPVFVSLDDFNKINDNLLKISSRIGEAAGAIQVLEKLYEKQQNVMKSWIDELESVEKKISKADEIIHYHEKRQS